MERSSSLTKMKKLLMILVMVSWCNVGVAKEYTLANYLYPGLTKKEFKKRIQGWNTKIHNIDEFKKTHSIGWCETTKKGPCIGWGVFFGSVYRKLFPEYKTEILSHYYQRHYDTSIDSNWYQDEPNTYPPKANFPYYVFENVTEPVTCKGYSRCSGSIGNGTLIAVVFSREEALAVATDPDYAKKIEKKRAEEAKRLEEKNKMEAEEAKRLEEMTTEEKEQIKMTSMVDKAKSTCKDLGFEEGTDRFVDCSFKLYTQKVELAAKNNKQIVVQGQSSGSNVMTIYDPVRDNNALIKRGMGLINGTCTLGDLSNC